MIIRRKQSLQSSPFNFIFAARTESLLSARMEAGPKPSLLNASYPDLHLNPAPLQANAVLILTVQ